MANALDVGILADVFAAITTHP